MKEDASKEVKATIKRRGVSNETKATAQLKFHEKDANPNNGLFTGVLKEVLVDYRTISEDSKGLTSFAGLSIPRLVFHFTSTHSSEAEQRHVYETLLPVESNVATIPGGSDEWRVNAIFRWVKHMMDVFYLKGRELTEAEMAALELPFVDYDEENQYVPVEPEVVIAGYKTIFDNIAAMFNGTWAEEGKTADGKPCYLDANGKGIRVWMKLLRARKQKNEWKNIGSNGELAFDPFVGEGVIEIQKTNIPPMVLKLDLSRESITPKVTNKQPNVAVPMAGSVMAPAMPPQNAGFAADPYAATGEEMPF